MAVPGQARKIRGGGFAEQPNNVRFFHQAEQAPAWTVRFGGEFWRRPTFDETASPATAEGLASVNPSFSIGDVIERVSHAWEADASGQPQVNGTTYSARFDSRGLRLSPHRPDEGSEATGGAESNEQSAAAAPSIPDPATAIHFRTLSVQRDGESYTGSGAMEWSVTGNAIQGLHSAEWAVVEHYEADAAGVGVTWVFNRPLPGAGPIKVEASVEGLSYAGATEKGHHFADATGTARVRVGQAFAVDAAGTRWDLDVNAAPDNSGTLIVEVSENIQSEAVYPLVIDPLIGAEFGMDKPVSSAASSGQVNSAVAAGSGQFLVVWEDSRGTGATGTDIYGARVSTKGQVLDPRGIVVCATYGTQQTPSVAASGGTYLVTWRDNRSGIEIYAGRVTSSGVALDPLGIPVTAATGTQSDPAVAAGPPGFLVVWEDNRNSGVSGLDILGARISTAGVVLDPFGITVCTNASNQQNVTVASYSGGFFVAWQDERNSAADDIFGARVTSDGLVQDPFGISIAVAAGTQSVPSAAANAGGILVAWQDPRQGNSDVFAARVTTAGAVLDATGIPVSTNSTSESVPAVAANASTFVVTWQDARNGNNDIFAARISSAGAVQETNGLAICTNSTTSQSAPAIGGGSAGFFISWNDNRNAAVAGNDIFGARLTSLGVVQDTNGFGVSLAGAAQSSPAVAFNGTNYLVVWQDDRGALTNGSDIRGARVSAAGKVLDVAGINVCGLAGDQGNPTVAAGAGSFLVAWEDDRNDLTTGIDIYGTRVTAAGVVQDSAGLALSTAANDQFSPVAAGNSSTYFVAWEDTRSGTSSDLYGTRVNQSGVVSNPTGIAISTTGQDEILPAAAATPDGFLIVWEDANDILGARVTNAGVVSDPSGSPIDINVGGSGAAPAVASHGTNYLVVWADDRNDTAYDIYAGRVDGDGSSPDSGSDGFPVCTLPGTQYSPAASADGDAFVAMWYSNGSGGTDLQSARISTTGVVLDFLSLPTIGSEDRSGPALAYGGADKFLVVSDSFRENSERVTANLYSPETPTANVTVQLGAPAFVVSESGKFAKIKVSLKGKYSGVISVDFSTADNTATAGTDYMPLSGRLVFANKKTSVTIAIPIIGDADDEANETVALRLQNPTGGALLGLRHTALLTITDDDL